MGQNQVKHFLNLDQKELDLISVPPNGSIQGAMEKIVKGKFRIVVVMEDDKVLGVVSEKDILKKVIIPKKEDLNSPVSAIMTSPVKTVSPEDTISHCLDLLRELNCRHLPTCDPTSGKLLGIMTEREITNALVKNLNL